METLLASPSLLALACVLVLLGTLVQAGLGMGFGLFAAPLLALIDPVFVPVPAIYMGLLVSSYVVIGQRRLVRWREVRLGLGGRLFGVMLATLLLGVIADERTFQLLFGCMILLTLLLSLCGWHMKIGRVSLFGMGQLSGFMGTITSVGGPPMALLYQHQSAAEARPTLAAFFTLGGVMSLAGLYLSGWAGWAETLATLVLLPPMLLGLFVSRYLRGAFDRSFRPWLVGISAAAAALLIYRGLLGT